MIKEVKIPDYKCNEECKFLKNGECYVVSSVGYYDAPELNSDCKFKNCRFVNEKKN